MGTLPDQLKTEFFVINLHALKDALDDKLKSTLDGMIAALKQSVKQDLEAIQAFID